MSEGQNTRSSTTEYSYQMRDIEKSRKSHSEPKIARVEVVKIGSEEAPLTLVAYHSSGGSRNGGRRDSKIREQLENLEPEWDMPFWFAGKASPEGSDDPTLLLETDCLDSQKCKDLKLPALGGYVVYVAVRAERKDVAQSLHLVKRESDQQRPAELTSVVGKILRYEEATGSSRGGATSVNRGVYLDIAKLLIHEQNVILEGVPGTGKSFAIEKLRSLWADASEQATGERRELADNPRVVVLHPSSSYEDLIEGIRLRVPDDQDSSQSGSQGLTSDKPSPEDANDQNGAS